MVMLKDRVVWIIMMTLDYKINNVRHKHTITNGVYSQSDDADECIKNIDPLDPRIIGVVEILNGDTEIKIEKDETESDGLGRTRYITYKNSHGEIVNVTLAMDVDTIK